MRTNILLALCLAFAVTGCARRGVLVDKRLKPSPFAYSAGVDGIYTFLLRDERGRVHSQMVPAEVFARYDVGDYFDDRQPAPARQESGYSKDTSDSKDVRPVSTSMRRASAHSVAQHHSSKKKHVAHRKSHRSPRVAAHGGEDDPRPPQEGPAKPKATVSVEVQP